MFRQEEIVEKKITKLEQDCLLEALTEANKTRSALWNELDRPTTIRLLVSQVALWQELCDARDKCRITAQALRAGRHDN